MAIPITELVLVVDTRWIAIGDSPARFEGTMEIIRERDGGAGELVWSGKTAVYDHEIAARHVAEAEGMAKLESFAATLD